MDANRSGNNDDQFVITVRGEIDWGNAESLQRQFIAMLHPPIGRIALDLSQVAFMDCAGLGMLIAIDQYIKARGGSMRVVATSPAVARLFEVIGSLVALPDFCAARFPHAGRVRNRASSTRRPPTRAPVRARPQ